MCSINRQNSINNKNSSFLSSLTSSFITALNYEIGKTLHKYFPDFMIYFLHKTTLACKMQFLFKLQAIRNGVGIRRVRKW